MIYSRRLYGPAAAAGAASSILTVPAGHTYVLQTLSIVTASPPAGTFFTLAVNGSGAANRIFRRVVVNDTTALELELRFVLHAGDVLWQQGSTSITFSIHGYDLTD